MHPQLQLSPRLSLPHAYTMKCTSNLCHALCLQLVVRQRELMCAPCLEAGILAKVRRALSALQMQQGRGLALQTAWVSRLQRQAQRTQRLSRVPCQPACPQAHRILAMKC